MVKSVVNEIVLGIAAKVKAIYKDKGDYPIYTNNEEQGNRRKRKSRNWT